MSEAEQEQELGITESKEHSPGEWYAEVVQKAELADYAPMGGFIVTRPRGYALWERLQDHLDGWFKETGVENVYFPMMIPESYLDKEKEVVEGFDPEMAWVTKGGYEELEEPLAVRPTSESIIAPYMSKWIRSHRDLPLLLNQWCSVVRWEATETKPFFRTKEFLWQEGHTAHADAEDAWAQTRLRLDQYEKLYGEVLAMPVLKGKKPDHDKFPGAHTTTTVEALMPDGKSVQGGTSHYLGTTFGEAFDITYVDEDEAVQTAHTASWGVSWRAIGALIMTHADDQGMVVPPKLAKEQVVIVPIWTQDNREEVLAYAAWIEEALAAADIRVHLDDREERNPGFKFNEWELKGVPLRIEVGPNEVADETVTLVHRPDGEQREAAREDIVDAVNDDLDVIHEKLYDAAAANLAENVRHAFSREEVLGTIGRYGGYVKVPWCGNADDEAVIKDEIAAEIVLQPMEGDLDLNDEFDIAADESVTCAICGEPADQVAYFAKTY